MQKPILDCETQEERSIWLQSVKHLIHLSDLYKKLNIDIFLTPYIESKLLRIS